MNDTHQLSKRTREEVIKRINENPEFIINGLSVGTGNAGDLQTIDWLKKWRVSGRDWPWFVKRSFRTVREIEGKPAKIRKLVPPIREGLLSKEFLDEFSKGHLSIQSLSLSCPYCGETNKIVTFAIFKKNGKRISGIKCPSCRKLIDHAGLTLMYYCGYELLTLTSYRDKDYVNEIPHLIKWRKNGWLKLLEKAGDEWKLVEEPRVPSSPILLTDLHGRLSDAIFELAKTKSKFCTEEVIKKLRELEQVSAERTLKRLGLRFEDGKWQIDEKALNDIKRLLEAETKRWPSLGVIVFKNPYFKLQSRTMYVDMPNAAGSNPSLFSAFLVFAQKSYRL